MMKKRRRKDLIVEIQCPFCGKVYEVEVNGEGYAAWVNGELIQNALYDLNPTDRESLISDLCPECQVKIFGE